MGGGARVPLPLGVRMVWVMWPTVLAVAVTVCLIWATWIWRD